MPDVREVSDVTDVVVFRNAKNPSGFFVPHPREVPDVTDVMVAQNIKPLDVTTDATC